MTPPRRLHKPARNVACVLATAVLLTGLFSAPAAFATEPTIPPLPSEQLDDEGTGEPESVETLLAPNPMDANLQLSPTSVNPGEKVRVFGGPARANITLSFTPLAWPYSGNTDEGSLVLQSQVKINNAGMADSWLTIPAAVAPGEYHVSYSCTSSDMVLCYGEMTLTVLGDVPTTRPAGTAMVLSANPLKGKAGSPIELTGSCTYNGVASDAINTDWGYAGQGIIGWTEPLANFPLNAGVLTNGQTTVPSDAVPLGAQDHFKNALRSRCALDDMTFGYSYIEYTVLEKGTTSGPPPTSGPPTPTTSPTPTPTVTTNETAAVQPPRELAATGTNQNSSAMLALAAATLGAAALLTRSRRRTN